MNWRNIYYKNLKNIAYACKCNRYVTLKDQIHSVWIERDVRRIDFVVIFFQWTQNWTALNFEVNFQPLIQPYSSRLINNFCRGGWALLSVSKLERQRTSGTQKRSKSDFMYYRKFIFWPARNLRKGFRGLVIIQYTLAAVCIEFLTNLQENGNRHGRIQLIEV